MYFDRLFWNGKIADCATVAIFLSSGENSHFPNSKQTVKVQFSLDMLEKWFFLSYLLKLNSIQQLLSKNVECCSVWVNRIEKIIFLTCLVKIVLWPFVLERENSWLRNWCYFPVSKQTVKVQFSLAGLGKWFFLP